MKNLLESDALVNSAELVEIIGADFETINNWIRRGIIRRAQIGGRLLRNRLFSTEEVYKAALKHELVKFGMSPSSANAAINELWVKWGKRDDAGEKQRIYAMVRPTEDSWTAELCWQKLSGGQFYRLERSLVAAKADEFRFANRAAVMIPMSDVLSDITGRLSELFGGKKSTQKRNGRK